MFRSDLLKDKVIIVTGGGSGLGKSMALRLAELGARLVLTSRSVERLAEAVKEVEARGAAGLAVGCDVRDPAQVDAMVQKTVAHFGRVDALINNAAGNFLAKTETLSPNAFNAVIDIVLRGTFYCTHAVGKQMIAQKTGGSILSIVATYAMGSGSAYVVPSASAKAGVLVMMRSLAVEWAQHNIRCNAIAPGPFPTEGAFSRLVPSGLAEASGRMLKHRIPMNRFGEHLELANLAAYLLADESSYITGDCVVIDGGGALMAGDFNAMTAFDQDALGQMFDAMKPKKQ
jgi:NAD(P)-dependent dehydrogenase (short-subunit alcohol dehydrogenase family)